MPIRPSDFGIREAIAKLTTFGYSHAPFPLTPALSLREREHHRPRIRQPEPLAVVAMRSLVLPLPEGEGRGEGEWALESADSGSFAIGFVTRLALATECIFPNAIPPLNKSDHSNNNL